MTRIPLRLFLIAVAPLFASCTSPTFSEQIDQSLETVLRSVEGPWRGLQITASGNPLTLEFSLTQQTNGQLQGSGTMKESNTASPLPITVAGTFQRPTLVLTFGGMVYEGRAVTGTFRGDYTTVGGISDSLRLTAEGYERAIPMLLQER